MMARCRMSREGMYEARRSKPEGRKKAEDRIPKSEKVEKGDLAALVLRPNGLNGLGFENWRCEKERGRRLADKQKCP